MDKKIDVAAPAESLFQPFDHGSLHLANRIVMAPMTRCFSPNGVPGEDVVRYYRRRAEGGVIVVGRSLLANPDWLAKSRWCGSARAFFAIRAHDARLNVSGGVVWYRGEEQCRRA